ncbi:FAD-dependent oxidoreductase [Parvularcula maris]|uniref:FAD-dependent monooxygenase n=1 Tax=Parvularcula maris TaxID=2965077 RepID=A0A9X2L876_9PROT|nr:NAD(P)/FAD-dependent oxidoreductase [Parvularcula maris]MCQ8184783.1 FAD-dependent monooxygenase [Parvularcula maris]
MLRIAIVGCGLGGMAAAIALRRQGHEVTLIERFGDPKPLGAGLLLQPPGLAALGELGLLDEVLGAGQPILRLDGRTEKGRAVFDVAYPDLHPGAFGFGIHRGVLFDRLLEAALLEGAALVTGRMVTGHRLQDGKRVLAAEEGELGPFDLVVDASGARSVLREPGRTERAKPYPFGAVWGIMPMRRGHETVLQQRYRGAAKMIGRLPIGRGPKGEGPLAAFFWSLPIAQLQEWPETDMAAWRREVSSIWPEIEEEIGVFEKPGDLVPATYNDVVLSAPAGEGIVFLGDAAHGMSPQLGQGANLAIQDGVALAEAIAASEHVDAALRAFVRQRAGCWGFYQQMSRALTPFFQSDSSLLPPLRDAAFARLYRLPFLRRQMLLTLAGFKTGPLSHRRPEAVLKKVAEANRDVRRPEDCNQSNKLAKTVTVEHNARESAF